MNWKLVPYIFILAFAIVTALLRYLIVPQWTPTIHILVFLIHFTFLSIIWIFIKYLSNFLDKYISFEKAPLKRIVVQILIAVLIIAPVYFIVVKNIDRLNIPSLTRQFLLVISVLLLVFILLMNLGYNAFYFFKQWQRSVEEKAKLEIEALLLSKEKNIMQYQHLKNQVNPHFLFNTLTSLDGLIVSQPELASQFIRHLSKVYRYVLEHQENEVVSIQTEVNFIQNYIKVLKIKHGDALQIDLQISEEASEKGIAMVTLQMLIDNAIKHNMAHIDAPLHISIRNEGDYLSIKNNKQIRKQIDTSTKHGLKHLTQLYHFITAVPVQINDTPGFFEVKLPLL